MSLLFSEEDKQQFLAIRNTIPGGRVYWDLLQRAEKHLTLAQTEMDVLAVHDTETLRNLLMDIAVAFRFQAADSHLKWLEQTLYNLVQIPSISTQKTDYTETNLLTTHLPSSKLPVSSNYKPTSPTLNSANPVADCSSTTHSTICSVNSAIALCLDIAGEQFALSLRETLYQHLQQALQAPPPANCPLALSNRILIATLIGQTDQLQQQRQHLSKLVQSLTSQHPNVKTHLLYGQLAIADEALQRKLSGESIYSRFLEDYKPYLLHLSYQFLYQKPLAAEGPHPVPRFATFCSEQTTLRPSSNLLLYLAARAKSEDSQTAGLARWLWDQIYANSFGQGDGAPSGLFCFSLLPHSASATSQQQAKLPLEKVFCDGHAYQRNQWQEGSLLASAAPSYTHPPSATATPEIINAAACTYPGNTLLSYRNERLVLSSQIFECGSHETAFQYQNIADHIKTIGEGVSYRSATWETTYLLATNVTQPPIQWTRTWILCGASVCFIIDRHSSSNPIRPVWQWDFNDSDGCTSLKKVPNDRIVLRRNNVGMKVFHIGPVEFVDNSTANTQSIAWQATQATREATTAHALAMGDYGLVSGWHLRGTEISQFALEGPGKNEYWEIQITSQSSIQLRASHLNQTWSLPFSTHA